MAEMYYYGPVELGFLTSGVSLIFIGFFIMFERKFKNHEDYLWISLSCLALGAYYIEEECYMFIECSSLIRKTLTWTLIDIPSLVGMPITYLTKMPYWIFQKWLWTKMRFGDKIVSQVSVGIVLTAIQL